MTPDPTVGGIRIWMLSLLMSRASEGNIAAKAIMASMSSVVLKKTPAVAVPRRMSLRPMEEPARKAKGMVGAEAAEGRLERLADCERFSP
jgi:hypothetical protein